MKNALKISIPTTISIIGSVLLYNILHKLLTALFMEQSKLIPEVKNDFPGRCNSHRSGKRCRKSKTEFRRNPACGNRRNGDIYTFR